MTLLGGGFGRKSKTDFVVRGGAAVEGEGGAPVRVQWTPRGRHAPRLLPRGGGRAARSRPRRAGQADGMAAPLVGADHPLDLRRRRQGSGGERDRDGRARHAVRHSQPAHRDAARSRRTRASAGSARSTTFRMRSRCSRSSPSWPPPPGAIPKDYLLELIGPARRIDTRTFSDSWNYGESPERYPLDTGRMRRVVELAARERRLGPQAARRARPGHRGDLQLRQLRRHRGRGRRRRQGRHQGRSRAWTSPSTAGCTSTPTASARRWRARWSWD